jgi:hypothetical protein
MPALKLLIHNDVFVFWVVIAATIMFVVTLVLVPLILIRLPRDYFNRPHRDRKIDVTGHPAVRLVFVIVKNLFGAIFILLGIAMLVLPGQGVLTIVVGLMMLDFPGKYEVELWALRHRSVRRAINWIREKAHRPPLDVAPD